MTTMMGLWVLVAAWGSEPEAEEEPVEAVAEQVAPDRGPAEDESEEQTLEERLENLAEVVEVYSDTTYDRLSRTLRDLGYKAGKARRRGTVFRPETSWYPSVWLTPDGGVQFTRTPPKVTLPILGGEVPVQGGCVGAPQLSLPSTGRVLDELVQAVDPGNHEEVYRVLEDNRIACLDPAAALVSERRMNPKKRRVLEAAEDDIRQWQGAVMQQSFVQTLMAKWQWMHELWAADAPASERRAELLDHWCTRTQSPEGEQARELVAKFLEDVVQVSDTPLTDAEIARVRSECWGDWPLQEAPEAVAEGP